MYPSLQRSYAVKSVRKRLNSEVEIVRVENGAFRPLKATLSTFLTHIVSALCYIVGGISLSVFFYFNRNVQMKKYVLR